MGKKNNDPDPQQSQAYTDDIAYRARIEAARAAAEGDADTARGLLDYAQTVEAQRAQQQKNG